MESEEAEKGWAWWWVPVIPVPRRQKLENCHKVKTSLGYIASSRPARETLTPTPKQRDGRVAIRTGP